MTEAWLRHFEDRFSALSSRIERPERAIPISIKIRVTGGCFHREHSPRAYAIIDDVLSKTDIAADGAVMEEHESGPEILLWLAVTAGSLNLATSIVNFITAIVKARSEGNRKGDGPDSPLDIIVRGTGYDGEYREKQVLRIDSNRSLDQARLQRQLDQAITELFGDTDADR